MAGAVARRWLGVVIVALVLGVGTFLVVRYVPAGSEGVAVGDRAPDIRVARIPGGDSINLRTAFRGHVTLINVWATWCVPCQTEMPSIERLYQQYRNRGFRVAATSIDRSEPGPVETFAQRYGLTFDILQDQSGTIESAYQLMGTPESFLLDRDGRIQYVALGAETWDSPANRQRVEHLLAQDE